MKDKCPLNVYFTKEKQTRAIDYWGNCGTVVGWSKPIKLSCPPPASVGGWWIFKRDRDNAELGTHPKMITFCRECPKKCKKK